MATPITTVEELQAMVLVGTVSYYLANDIDASDTINWNAGAGFNPVSIDRYATVDIDGRGHTIKDLYINRPTETRVGLLRYYGGTHTFENILFENIYVSGYEDVGSLCGVVTAAISSCGVKSGQVIAAYGSNYDTGGLVGRLYSGSITKCYSNASVTLNSATWGLGGLVGRNGGTITDCYSLGAVTKTTGYVPARVGGFVGYNLGTINRCFSTGKVLPVQGSNLECNGFVGYNAGTILASHWDTESSGYTKGTQPETDPPSGRTTAQMKQEATFAGWDFKRTWKIVEGKSYPSLRIGATKKRASKSA
jgi:hypothetical protein